MIQTGGEEYVIAHVPKSLLDVKEHERSHGAHIIFKRSAMSGSHAKDESCGFSGKLHWNLLKSSDIVTALDYSTFNFYSSPSSPSSSSSLSSSLSSIIIDHRQSTCIIIVRLHHHHYRYRHHCAIIFVTIMSE